MRRTVSAFMRLELSGPTRLLLSAAVARPAAPIEETLSLRHDGRVLPVRELVDLHGARVHVADADAGDLDIEYAAIVDGVVAPAPVDELDLVRYLRPSRYCESDILTPTARVEFRGLHGRELLDAVTEWVAEHLDYVPGSSLPTDGAVRTLLNRQGVCRDYAHLSIALLRALDVPARMVSVYAPGLRPMDFHAVAEAHLDGVWQVVDATRLAPRGTMLRIATGRDAADTAFLTTHHTDIGLVSLDVTAEVDDLPVEDPHALARLG